MSPVVVCDSSALVALLLDSGPAGRWAAEALDGRGLAAPSLLPFEVANVIRRQELADRASPDQAALAHRDLLDLQIQLWPHETVASRIWEHRENLTAYDAAYVAVAELLGCPLVTLDTRIAGAPGLACTVNTP